MYMDITGPWHQFVLWDVDGCEDCKGLCYQVTTKPASGIISLTG